MKSTSFYIVLLSTILLTSAHQMGAPNFECGPHGRFEYCINGNPGCVVGCHCHPGYYFDTESKICEANDILRRNYRRDYMDIAPTPTPFTTTKLCPTPTQSNIIDKNVDAITKDADDLGDWLYNQFFKTIENQVINKTDEEKPPSRRSGTDDSKTSTSAPAVSIQRRSRRKHSKKQSKKKKRHSKRGGLRKKLLRISEDDSLFDSSSGSSDSSDSSSSSSSDSDSSSSESESSRSRERSKDHGHRKILMINKKPHPPLPSFIFMPNMETPYFPPLGLPPPPIMPMYPMIPVPPMMPSISIIQSTPAAAESQATTAHSEATTTTATAATTAATTAAATAAATDAPAAPEPPPPDIDAPEEPDPANEVAAERSGYGGRKYRKGNAREKFMRKIRDKMKRRHELPQPINYFPDEVNDPVLGRMNIPDAFPESFMYDERQEFDERPTGQDVNFKYLSQLIHKVNKTDAKHVPSKPGQMPGNMPRRMPGKMPVKMPHPRNFKPTHIPNETSQRRQGDKNDAPLMFNEKDDYADLGRQIAALVRKIDTKGEHQINIDYEKSVSGNISPQAMFNDNGMSSRSYWERFVRSPFKFTFDTEQYSDLDSGEKLVSLEDQVSNTATTKRTLTLQQVENMINIIESVKAVHDKRIRDNIEHAKERRKAPSMTKNPALLLEFDGWDKRYVVKQNQQHTKENLTNIVNKAHIDINYKKSQPINLNVTYRANVLPSAKTNLIPEKEIPRNVIAKTRRSDNLILEKQRRDNVIPEKQRPNNIIPEKHIYNINNLPQRFKMPLSSLLQHASRQQSHPGLPIRNAQYLKPIYLSQNQRPPPVVSYKNWSPNKGTYLYENVVSAPDYSLAPLNKPSSYFHHQVQHFDFFD